MYMTTREKSAIFVTMVLAVTTITLLSSTTASFVGSVLAAKTHPSHHHVKNSNDISGGGGSTDNSGFNGNTDTSTNDNTPQSTSNDNGNLKNLFACETAAANGSGKLTETDVINCYSQTFSDNSASSGNGNAQVGDGTTSDSSGSSLDSGSSTSTSSHPHHHHHSSGSISDSTTGPSGSP